jgi:hypothetical protein
MRKKKGEVSPLMISFKFNNTMRRELINDSIILLDFTNESETCDFLVVGGEGGTKR